MPFSKELLKGAAETIILQALHDEGEAYGYKLIVHIRETSQTIFDLKEGTLYPLLYRLEKNKLVTSREQATPSGKKRRYYRLTSKGKKQLASQKEELRSFIQGLRHSLPLTSQSV